MKINRMYYVLSIIKMTPDIDKNKCLRLQNVLTYLNPQINEQIQTDLSS